MKFRKKELRNKKILVIVYFTLAHYCSLNTCLLKGKHSQTEKLLRYHILRKVKPQTEAKFAMAVISQTEDGQVHKAYLATC